MKKLNSSAVQLYCARPVSEPISCIDDLHLTDDVRVNLMMMICMYTTVGLGVWAVLWADKHKTQQCPAYNDMRSSARLKWVFTFHSSPLFQLNVE